jgi:glutamate formiminotransferase
MSAIYQCVPNFSEGRRPEVVAEIAGAIRCIPGANLINYSADWDHNRCVMTILGDADAVFNAALAAAKVAIEAIDLRAHTGIHPRIGALDVLPVIPLRNTGREEAVELARKIGRELAGRFDLPVYFYEWAAEPARRNALPDLRKGGFEAFQSRVLTNELAPDAGPDRAHPTAGIAVVGARDPLVAYNVNFSAPNAEIAHRIARKIRAERDTHLELSGVRALGLFLTSKNQAQVSMNLTRPELTHLPALYNFIRNEGAKFGITHLESEIIGAIPLASLGGLPPKAIHWNAYHPAQILENSLAASN